MSLAGKPDVHARAADDVVDLLCHDHRALIDLLDAAFASTGTARYRTIQRLRGRLLAHFDAEHRIVDPLVRARVDGGRHVLCTLREHESRMRERLATLDGMGDYAADFADVLTCFETHLLAHVAIADFDLHPCLREVTSPAERRQLAADFGAAGTARSAGTRAGQRRSSGVTSLAARRLRLPLGFLRAAS
jgi:hypothetical protein